ncbi:MAG TPA: sigma-70 family RNA polymerase sigma factor, partial [Pirellulaceae bacterium]|nr:sigma-70 family RNA polymerase sigma factor [Pirellulaceae bacterium]
RRETTGHDHLPEPSIDSSPGTAIEASERREEVLELLEQLRNPRQRLIIELHYLKEKPFPEIAKLINVSLSNVYVDHHRALAKLRELRANRGTHG